jgi:hypothetical protein
VQLREREEDQLALPQDSKGDGGDRARNLDHRREILVLPRVQVRELIASLQPGSLRGYRESLLHWSIRFHR